MNACISIAQSSVRYTGTLHAEAGEQGPALTSWGTSTVPRVCGAAHVPSVRQQCFSGRAGDLSGPCEARGDGCAGTFMRFLPLACFFRSFFLRETSPP